MCDYPLQYITEEKSFEKMRVGHSKKCNFELYKSQWKYFEEMLNFKYVIIYINSYVIINIKSIFEDPCEKFNLQIFRSTFFIWMIFQYILI